MKTRNYYKKYSILYLKVVKKIIIINLIVVSSMPLIKKLIIKLIK